MNRQRINLVLTLWLGLLSAGGAVGPADAEPAASRGLRTALFAAG